MQWLCRAQDVTQTGGVSAFYNLGERQWALPYRETTGYIIPTFLAYYKHTKDENYCRRAIAMGNWEVNVQLPDGAVGEPREDGSVQAKVFNTGQVMLGWCALYDETRDVQYLDAARRASDWLVTMQDADSGWSRFSNAGANCIDSRVAWALLAVSSRTGHESYRQAAVQKIKWVLRQQQPNGWFDKSSLAENERPWTHAIAYTISGLLESARFLESDQPQIMDSVIKASHKIRTYYESRQKGQVNYLPCTFDSEWRSQDEHSCLTGDAQMAIIWFQLAEMTRDKSYSDAASKILDQVKQTQLLKTRKLDLRGGIAGSYPVDNGYCCKRILNWATKFFADAIMIKQKWHDGALLLG